MEHKAQSLPEDVFQISGWTITCKKNNILNSEELLNFSKDLAVKNLPEMIFGNNCLRLQKNTFCLNFNAFDALKALDNTAVLKVAYSKNWLKSKESSLEDPDLLKDVEQYDWTFTTLHPGTATKIDTNGTITPLEAQPTTDKIDMERLKKQDQILYYNEIILFEDELADNGISQLSVRVRVMPSCFFILQRFWLRIDDVLFRLVETRIFHDYTTNFLIRDFQAKESPFKTIVQMLPDPTKYSEINTVSPLLKLRHSIVEKLYI